MMSIAYPTQAFNDVMELENLQSLNFYSSEDYKTDIMLEQLTGCHMASTFLSPSAPKSPSFNDYKLGNAGAFCQNSLLSWTAKHPEHWSSVEVLDWLYYMADLHQVNSKKFRGEAFQNMSGPRLCQMTRREFVKLEPEYGSRIYDILQAMLSDAKFNEPTTYDYSSLDTPTSQIIHDRLFTTLQPVDKMDIEETNMLHNDSQSLSLLVDDSEVRVSMDGYWYDIDIPSKIDFPDADGGYVSGGSDASQESCGDGLQSRLGSCSSDVFEPAASNDGLSVQHKNFKTRCPYGNRLRCGSSTSVDEGFGCEEKGKSRGTRRLGHGSKGNHLWEFIRDLLKNPTYSPSLLKWEDKESGVFRFVQSEAVAQMWGRKKNNPGMTYEKLSRAMRFCRTAGYFDDVPKNGKFPKKLCFKFGPKAYGWKED